MLCFISARNRKELKPRVEPAYGKQLQLLCDTKCSMSHGTAVDPSAFFNNFFFFKAANQPPAAYNSSLDLLQTSNMFASANFCSCTLMVLTPQNPFDAAPAHTPRDSVTTFPSTSTRQNFTELVDFSFLYCSMTRRELGRMGSWVR